MPRKAKDEVVKDEKKLVSSKKTQKTKSAEKGATAKAVASKKGVLKEAKVSKSADKKSANATVKKVKAPTSKEKPNTKVASKKTTSSKKTSTVKKATKKSGTKKPFIEDYYDLPTSYEKTLVKILAQTPSILFVYWEISNSDKQKFIKAYGENFFEQTTPYLLVINKDKNYQFEVEINDYANSWYLHIPDSDCKYEIVLMRKNKNMGFGAPNDTFITSSNEITSPKPFSLRMLKLAMLNKKIYLLLL